MAVLAADNAGARRSAGAAPVSAHPAFPAIVALWFAALLGLGSLILPNILLERLTTVTGIAALIPSAAPPLGFTARATIALGAAVFGAVLGLVLARQVANGHAPKPRARFSRDDEHPRRPISAHELGEEGLGESASSASFGTAAPRPAATKRRSLAIAEDSSPSPYLEAAPVPGYQQTTDEAGEALELGDFAEQFEPIPPSEDQDCSMTEETEFDRPGEQDFDQGKRQEFIAPAQADATLPRAFDPLPGHEVEDDDEVDPVDALPFSAPSLRREATPVADSGQDNEPSGEEISDFSARPLGAVPEAYDPAAASPSLTVVDARDDDGQGGDDPGKENRPLDQLGLVQLATRLGSAIERRRALRAAQGGPGGGSRAVFAGAEDFDAAEAEDAARARADFFAGSRAPVDEPRFEPPDRANAAPRVAPRAMRAPLDELEFDELEFDEDEATDDDLSASLSLPLRKRPEPGRPAEQAPIPAPFSAETFEQASDFDEAEEEHDDPTADQEYSSLLAMKNPFRKEEEFVRIEEPEPEEDEIEATVTFPERKDEEAPETPAQARPFDPPAGAADSRPANAPRDNGDAERELRAALETLQRMSGTA